jgi:hypothetical protein
LRPLRPGRCQAPCSFRPRRSSRPRRFSPLMDSRACCVPHPTMRFTGFPRTDDACLRSRRASSPMPTLQSFSLPRSGPRVTARSCPPVVGRQRQLDSGALIRSEIRCAEHSWPSPDARCSHGLPCLEPHPIAFTSASARERATKKVRLGPAQARAGRVAESATSASPRPEGLGSARHARGRMDRAWRHHHARDSGNIGPSLLPPKRLPCRSLPPRTMVIVHGRSHGAP